MSMRACGLALLAATCCAAWSGGSVKAAVIFDSLANAQNGTGSIDNTLGASFSTGGSSYALTNVQLSLSNAGAGGHTIAVDLAADSATSPGSTLDQLASISDSTLSSAASVVNIPVSGVSLAADTRYWIVLSSPNSPAKWAYSDSDAGVGVASEYYSDNGVFPNSEGPYLMEITADPTSAVPEPASVALLGAGLAAMGGARRRRRKLS